MEEKLVTLAIHTFEKAQILKTMLETEDVEGMRSMMHHSTQRRALFDKK